MSDESIINLSDSAKTTVRNYAMVAGFMALFIYTTIHTAVFLSVGGSPTIQDYTFFRAIIAVALIMFGSILAFVHKRDLVSITFIMMGLGLLLVVMGTVLSGGILTGLSYSYMAVAVILAVAMLFTRNEQRFVCAAVLIPGYAISLIGGLACSADIIDASALMSMHAAGSVITALVSVYCALCIGLENPRFPGYILLTADEEYEICDGRPVHFKVSGSILGYSLIMVPIMACIFRSFGLFNMTISDLGASFCSCGLLLIFTGFLMLVAGRMKFTPFMFMMMGILMALIPMVQVPWLYTVSFIIVGILCLFRADRRIIVGAAVILYGLDFLFEVYGPLANEAVSLAINIVQFVIFTYVCFALCSDDRLKLV